MSPSLSTPFVIWLVFRIYTLGPSIYGCPPRLFKGTRIRSSRVCTRPDTRTSPFLALPGFESGDRPEFRHEFVLHFRNGLNSWRTLTSIWGSLYLQEPSLTFVIKARKFLQKEVSASLNKGMYCSLYLKFLNQVFSVICL